MSTIRSSEDGTHIIADPRPSNVHPESMKALVGSAKAISNARLMALGIDPAQRAAAEQKRKSCWGLREGEVCYPPYHSSDAGSRRCPADRVREVAERLGFLLDRCFSDEVNWRDGGRIGPRLFASFQLKDEVSIVRNKTRCSLARAVEEAHEIAADPRALNSLWHGTTGLGKTHLQLAVFFTALENGYRLVYTYDQEMLRIAEGLRSFNEDVRKVAEAKRDTLLRVDAIFYNDLAMDKNPTERPGRPLLTGLLHEILEYGSGRFHATTNQTPQELEKPGDVGPRVISRILAAHRGRAPSLLFFQGDDQRMSWY